MTVWLTILSAALITLSMRLSFIYFHGKARLPSWFHRSLYFVPAAVLAAIVLPGIFAPQGILNLSLTNPRLWATLVASAVAWKTENAIPTMIAGMGTLWLLQLWL